MDTAARWRPGWLFFGLILPLAGFFELARRVSAGVPLRFDEPLLLYARALSGPVPDRVAVIASEIGYAWGVVPFDIALVLLLALCRQVRESVFAALALGGSALLNLGSKHLFARERPALWESIAPEHTFSFPSGHAMGAMTLAMVLVLLAWPTRWRWPVLAAMPVFVLLVGASRVYLGVHYPSDVLAGWALALAWVVAVFLLLFPRGCPPWRVRPD